MKREEIQQKYKWKVNDIFNSDEEWEKGYGELENMQD